MMCYFFWGIRDEAEDLPDPHKTLPDWAWTEWVQEQGIGE